MSIFVSKKIILIVIVYKKKKNKFAHWILRKITIGFSLAVASSQANNFLLHRHASSSSLTKHSLFYIFLSSSTVKIKKIKRESKGDPLTLSLTTLHS